MLNKERDQKHKGGLMCDAMGLGKVGGPSACACKQLIPSRLFKRSVLW
jgi:hypothetical protein